LLQKASDTNKFIREGCNEALDVMAENVTVFRALQCVIVGANHKSVVVRANVARIVDNVACALGAERVMGCSKEFQVGRGGKLRHLKEHFFAQEMVLQTGAKQLTDPALEVRTHAKHLFAELTSHAHFEKTLKATLKDSEIKNMQKALDAVTKK